MLHKPKVGMNERYSRYRVINVVHHKHAFTNTHTLTHTHKTYTRALMFVSTIGFFFK